MSGFVRGFFAFRTEIATQALDMAPVMSSITPPKTTTFVSLRAETGGQSECNREAI